nr:MAG TPA: hypothetical protein [Caudoviricetes sp.]
MYKLQNITMYYIVLQYLTECMKSYVIYLYYYILCIAI